MDFKVGDKVICVNSDGYEGVLTKDKEYEILDIDPSTITFSSDDGSRCSAFMHRFEPVKQQQTFDHPPKPKKDWYNQWIIEDKAHKKKIHDACMALKERRLKNNN